MYKGLLLLALLLLDGLLYQELVICQVEHHLMHAGKPRLGKRWVILLPAEGLMFQVCAQRQLFETFLLRSVDGLLTRPGLGGAAWILHEADHLVQIGRVWPLLLVLPPLQVSFLECHLGKFQGAGMTCCMRHDPHTQELCVDALPQ